MNWRVPTVALTAVLLCLLAPAVASADASSELGGPAMDREFDWQVVYPENVDEDAQDAGLAGLTRANLGTTGVGQPLVVWDAWDDFFIDLASGIAAPLVIGIYGTPLADIFLLQESGDDAQATAMDYGLWFDRTVDEELDISRVIDDTTPDNPLMLPVLNVSF